MICGCSHWKKGFEFRDSFDYIDTSDKDERGYHPAYTEKECCEAPFLSFTGLFVTIPYVALTLAYHLIRVVAVTAYLAIRIFYDYFSDFNKRSFSTIFFDRCSNIWTQWKIFGSVYLRAIPAMLGMLLGHLYTIFDPMQLTHGNSMNGRKLVAISEAFLNRGISLHKSFWLGICEAMDGYEFEGGGDPDKLGSTVLYVYGCYQPRAYVKPDLSEVISLSGKVLPNTKIIDSKKCC